MREGRVERIPESSEQLSARCYNRQNTVLYKGPVTQIQGRQKTSHDDSVRRGDRVCMASEFGAKNQKQTVRPATPR